MAAPVFNCLVFNAFVFQNDCVTIEENFGSPGFTLHYRERNDDEEVLAVLSAWLKVTTH